MLRRIIDIQFLTPVDRRRIMFSTFLILFLIIELK